MHVAELASLAFIPIPFPTVILSNELVNNGVNNAITGTKCLPWSLLACMFYNTTLHAK
jgi:hypothetical protein